MFLAAALLAFSSSALPSAPVAVPVPATQKHSINRYDIALYGAVIGWRTADYVTTQQFLERGDIETHLPTALVENKPGFAAYCAASAAGEILASVYLHRHGHARIARLADAFSIGHGTQMVYRNSQLGNWK